MKPLDLALQYMDLFFNGDDVEALRPLLAGDFRFEGPFYTYDSADAYIAALKADPPEDFAYELMHAFENESSACLVFEFTKPGIRIPMIQLFEIKENKITKVLLIFDTGVFTQM